MTADTLFQKYQTPFRYPKEVLTGSGIPGTYNELAVDCPFVFRHGGRFFMLHIGFDGIGYQTALAVSDDLVSWKHYAVVLAREPEGSTRWDRIGASGNWIIRKEDTLDGVPEIQKIDGYYWMLYHAYPEQGYEAGPAKISFARCPDEDLLHWEKLDQPVFSWEDGGDWERGGLYRGAVVRVGGRYAMLYNAKDQAEIWKEQTGLAWSDDLLHWERVQDQPVFSGTPGTWDWRFVSDPFPVRENGRWLNFYFGYDGNHAQEGLAWSGDLIHWEKLDHPLLPHGKKGSLDSIHAHKAAVVRHNGVLYHFYCGVSPAGNGSSAVCHGNQRRSILLATSQPL